MLSGIREGEVVPMGEQRPANEPERPEASTVEADEEVDTEGHSLLSYELGTTINRERQRQSEKAATEAERAAARSRSHRSIVDRLRGR
jgi:hypothetical protein